jgi:uncharacterized protein YegL
MSLLDGYDSVASRILPVVLLLDTSGSMREDDKIEVLNDSVTEMIEELTEVDAGHGSITLSIITFGGDSAKLVTNNTPIADIEYASLKANGRTPMGDALRIARELIEDREAFPSRSYRPTLALVSDGIPTDPSWDPELTQLVESERGSKATRFALAIGADADRELLARFSTGEVHEASEAAQIRNFLQFVTTTITQATISSFEPDVPVEAVSEDSILRLQSDDAF